MFFLVFKRRVKTVFQIIFCFKRFQKILEDIQFKTGKYGTIKGSFIFFEIQISSDSHDHGDCRMRLVILDLEVFHGEVLDVVHFPLELDYRKRHRFSFELNFERFDVVVVHVSVAQSVDELAGFEAWKIIFCKLYFNSTKKCEM